VSASDALQHCCQRGITDLPRREGAPHPGDVVLYATGNAIHRVNASGGQSVAVTTLQGNDWEHMWPTMLPDGRHFLFTAKHWAGLAESGAQGIYVGSVTMFEEMNRAISQSGLRPVIDRVFPFERSREALHYLESAQHFGKIVISMTA